MICISCGKEIPDESVFCGFCGSAVNIVVPATNERYCPQCNREFSSEMIFCGICGIKLEPIIRIIPLEFQVTDTFVIPQVGSVIKGHVLKGTINKSDTVYANNKACEILYMENSAIPVESATEGMEVTVFIKPDFERIEIGTIITNITTEKVAENPAKEAPKTEPSQAESKVEVINQSLVKDVSETEAKQDDNKTEVSVSAETSSEKEPSQVKEETQTETISEIPAQTIEPTAPVKNTNLLMQISSTSIYEGASAIDAEIFSGTIFIYPDRIETRAALSPKAEVFVLTEEIESVTKSNYMIAWSSIIITLKNSRQYTLASSVASSATIDRAIQYINNSIASEN